MRIDDAVAVVTGGASGLGAATARALAERGATVVALDLARSIESAETVPGLTYAEADVTDADGLGTAIERAAGLGPLRVLVNCAGIGPSERIVGRRGMHDLALYARVVGINLIGTFNALALCAARMAETEPVDADGQRGVIVNTASVAAFDGQVGQAAYSSSKGGVVGMTLPAARDLAQHGIRVVTIAPGIVDTPMMATVSDAYRAALAASVPFPARLARADEYARLALSIIDQDYLNGEVIRLDGALRMAPR
ncbi:SDR family NAD(P)-dependent oxidoreductase [Pseudolysinimonas sp.]|uniref:SDR family NAD(P)-dependent oxidoreductase n=1 Tax=Pseudolysinimonas sp. TaxID=2680009 RepID=UPI003F7DA21F